MSRMNATSTPIPDSHIDIEMEIIAENDSEKPYEASAPKQRTSFRAFCLIATCTMAMLVNVSMPYFIHFSIAHLFFQSSNNTSIAIALPTIGRDLNIQEAQLQWLISAYSLSSVSTLHDMWNRD